MADKFDFGALKMAFDFGGVEDELKRFSRETPELFHRGLEEAGQEFLRWASDGRPGNQARPPIRWGVLRGSGAVYIGGKLAQRFHQVIDPKAPNGTTPADIPNQITAPENEVTWSWNTSYAAAQHEGGFNPGPKTRQDPHAGPKWLEKHLLSDAKYFWKKVASRTRIQIAKRKAKS